jgi:hypothetical protein
LFRHQFLQDAADAVQLYLTNCKLSLQRHAQYSMVASSVPPDLSPAAGPFLVSLQRSWQPFKVSNSFASLHLPASQLKAGQAADVQSQQHLHAGDAVQRMLPAAGSFCVVDLQLVAVSVESHPLDQGHRAMACVQQLSNVIDGVAVLQALPDGQTYR